MADYNFRVTLDRLPLEQPPTESSRVCFDVSNHDDIFHIIDMMSKRPEFTPEDGKAFAVGLKLMTDVIMRHRNDPFFSELSPHVGDMMKIIKRDMKR